MNAEKFIQEKLGYQYFFTFNTYSDNWICLHADDLKHCYNIKDGLDLDITYGDTLLECAVNMCNKRGISLEPENKDDKESGEDLWFEYGTD